MKKVYTDNSLMQCGVVKSLLEANGIQCFLKNEAMSSVFGGSGFNPYQAYPELWVINDEDFDKALELVNTELEGQNDTE